MSTTLPPPDPLPLPGPPWLFEILLLVTFVLHVLAMNALLGGGILGAFCALRGRANVPYMRMIADRIYRILPIATAATITLGIAPLLFIQVLYGRFYFTSSILIGIPWIGLVVLLLAGYAGHYFIAMSDTIRREKHLWVAWASCLLVIAVGFLWTNNITLMHAPERFKDLYAADRLGWRINAGDPTVIPRFLHFLVAAVAVSGIGIMAIGHREKARGERDLGRACMRFGRNCFAIATFVQLAVGVWFLSSLPASVRSAFLGGNGVYTAHLFGAIAAALLAVVILLARCESSRALAAASGMLLLAIAGMALVRSWVREMEIGAVAGIDAIPVRTQGSALAVFVVIFVAGILALAWMFRRLRVESRLR